MDPIHSIGLNSISSGIDLDIALNVINCTFIAHSTAVLLYPPMFSSSGTLHHPPESGAFICYLHRNMSCATDLPEKNYCSDLGMGVRSRLKEFPNTFSIFDRAGASTMKAQIFFDVPPSPGNVLLVSDSHTQLELIRLILADVSTVVTAENGAVAERLARERRPDLIISDVVMPEVDGVELCRRLKSDPVTRTIPIFLVTGLRYDEPGITEAMDAGVDDYLDINAPRVLLKRKAERFISQSREKRARKEAEDRYRDLVESLPAIVYITQAEPPYAPIYVSFNIE